ncbi:unnamed protein product, partial [Mesorhabditis belari]|uniref:Protein Wnt n=1 Tax=Mesorhabditis belari TaxID=2138241 RepID=A0AAF3JAJ0_9BILA
MRRAFGLFLLIGYSNLLVDAIIDVAWWSSVAQLSTSPLLASSAARSQCTHLKGLSPGQSQICELFSDHMPAVGTGAHNAIQECQHQFRSHRWNCSTPFGSGYIGPIHQLGTREAAFTYAILSAGVAHEIGKRCKKGELSSCTCSQEPKPKEVEDDYSWGGCGDNVDYGSRFSRDFIDIREKEESVKRSNDNGRSLMNRRNNEAGRKILKRHTKPKCKCHGVSGACNLKTCWMQLPAIRDIGQHLLDKYRTAKRVQINNRGNLQLLANGNEYPVNRIAGKNGSERKARGVPPTDLVFMDDSPDYCRYDRSLGTVGTEGRHCKRGSSGAEGCDALCCGRGYNTLTLETTAKCKCKFEWCCKVVCQTCVNSTRVDICK